MDENDFLHNFLAPVSGKIEARFVHEPLPIDGLLEEGKVVVEGELDDTCSTSLLFKRVNGERSLRMIDVYKNTQHRKTGIFVRLVGSMSLVKKGFPILFLDAAVTNVSPITAEKEEITTRVVLHLPQATPDQRKLLYGSVSAEADQAEIAYREIAIAPLPGFWGPIWVGESRKLDLAFVGRLRRSAAEAYQAVLERTGESAFCDYRPVMEHMVFNNALSEHLLFRKMGLTVPIESQSAFFAALISQVEAL